MANNTRPSISEAINKIRYTDKPLEKEIYRIYIDCHGKNPTFLEELFKSPHTPIDILQNIIDTRTDLPTNAGVYAMINPNLKYDTSIITVSQVGKALSLARFENIKIPSNMAIQIFESNHVSESAKISLFNVLEEDNDLLKLFFDNPEVFGFDNMDKKDYTDICINIASNERLSEETRQKAFANSNILKIENPTPKMVNDTFEMILTSLNEMPIRNNEDTRDIVEYMIYCIENNLLSEEQIIKLINTIDILPFGIDEFEDIIIALAINTNNPDVIDCLIESDSNSALDIIINNPFTSHFTFTDSFSEGYDNFLLRFDTLTREDKMIKKLKSLIDITALDENDYKRIANDRYPVFKIAIAQNYFCPDEIGREIEKKYFDEPKIKFANDLRVYKNVLTKPIFDAILNLISNPNPVIVPMYKRGTSEAVLHLENFYNKDNCYLLNDIAEKSKIDLIIKNHLKTDMISILSNKENFDNFLSALEGFKQHQKNPDVIEKIDTLKQAFVSRRRALEFCKNHSENSFFVKVKPKKDFPIVPYVLNLEYINICLNNGTLNEQLDKLTADEISYLQEKLYSKTYATSDYEKAYQRIEEIEVILDKTMSIKKAQEEERKTHSLTKEKNQEDIII